MIEVKCISATPEPKKVIAAGVLNMRGDMRTDLSTITDEYADRIFKETTKTALNGVFEWVHLVFQVSGVTRAFTHQLVRHRVGFSFSQESMRFTQVKNMQVTAGPSIGDDPDDPAVEVWDKAVKDVENAYNELISLGVATQDARGILPTNVHTKIGFCTNYRSLVQLCGDRLCLQAQDEWRDVVGKMRKEVRRVWGDDFSDYLQPVCMHEKRCKFKSVFDRPCPMQDRWEE